MNTNLVGAISDNTPRAVSNETGYGVIALLMLLGALIGSFALTSYEIKFGPKDRKSNGWFLDFLINFLMGIGAAVLVPLFLRTIASTLFLQMRTDIEPKFVFTGFCALAAFASRRFLGVLPQKVFDSLNDTNDKVENTQERIDQVVEAVAYKTAKPPPELSDEMKRRFQQSPVQAYDSKAVAVIRALLNPQYSKSRSIGGIAFDTGLTFPETERCLQMLQQCGDVQLVTEEIPRRTKESWWALTEQGRKKFESALGQIEPDVPVMKTGLR